MTNLQKEIPSYLVEKRNLVQLIFFTAAFALVFINIYAPFGVETWFDVSRWELLFYSSLVILTGVLVVVISRVLMYQWCRKQSLTIFQYLVWVIVEVCCMASFYALFEKFVLDEARSLIQLIKVSIQNTALVLLLPYSVLWLYFSWRENRTQLVQLTNGQNVISNGGNMIPFRDEKGILRFSVKMEHLLYLEASDNYVNIYYIDKGAVARFMLRNSLKNMEELLAASEVIRCHRSYMVNFEKVKIMRKEKDGLHLELDIPSALDLPVSKTYWENVMNTFSKFCSSVNS